jgi:formimidoylglutamate deiminase
VTTYATTFLARLGVIDDRVVAQARYDVDVDGNIAWAGAADDPNAPPVLPRVRDWGHALVIPGMVDAHSHAFQRAIRGATQRREAGDPSDFWRWRDAMYRSANALDPEGIHRITRRAFEEMRRAGITCVGEFHYVHHQPDGTPYGDPNELSWQIVHAASDAGIRLVLLEVYYARAGAGQPPLPEQRRFCDRDVDAYARRVEALVAAGVDVGIAPHSVRAVGRDDLIALAELARVLDVPVHMHVSEQRRENDECRAEHGCSPLELLDDVGMLARPGRFTAVHAVFTAPGDHARMRGQHVCACPTTEADLGDGILPATELRDAGVNLCLGSDSNAVIDLVQEARALEMGERLRRGRRLCLGEGGMGLVLSSIAAAGGARSLGRASIGTLGIACAFDAAVIELGHPLLHGVAPEHALDAVMTAGHAGVVGRVVVGGREWD